MAMLNQSGEDLVKVQDVSSVFAERCAARNGWVRSMKRNWPIQAWICWYGFSCRFSCQFAATGEKRPFSVVQYYNICRYMHMGKYGNGHEQPCECKHIDECKNMETL